MNTQQQHNFLLERYGRIPEHYSLYLLPDDKRGGQEYVYTCMEAEDELFQNQVLNLECCFQR